MKDRCACGLTVTSFSRSTSHCFKSLKHKLLLVKFFISFEGGLDVDGSEGLGMVVEAGFVLEGAVVQGDDVEGFAGRKGAIRVVEEDFDVDGGKGEGMDGEVGRNVGVCVDGMEECGGGGEEELAGFGDVGGVVMVEAAVQEADVVGCFERPAAFAWMQVVGVE